jgi:hypothetical protein
LEDSDCIIFSIRRSGLSNLEASMNLRERIYLSNLCFNIE